MSRRYALLVAASRFVESSLRPLAGALPDVAELAAVLSSDKCGYQVRTCIDKPFAEMRQEINRFFRNGSSEDVLLLYISTHGLKDEFGNLYFAAPDTLIDELESTTLESHLLHRLSQSSRSLQQTLVLDSCFSGAFGRSYMAKDGVALRKEDIATSRETTTEPDRGLIVLTASTSYQLSFERERQSGNDAKTSVFTRHLVSGLKTGEADLDGDGFVTEGELFKYAATRTRVEMPAQTPQRWVIGSLGNDLVIGESPSVPAKALPESIASAMVNDIPEVSKVAVQALAKLAAGSDRGYRIAAREALAKLSTTNDSMQVRVAAAQALASCEAQPGNLPTVAAEAPQLAASAHLDKRLTQTTVRQSSTSSPRQQAASAPATVAPAPAGWDESDWPVNLDAAVWIPRTVTPLSGAINIAGHGDAPKGARLLLGLVVVGFVILLFVLNRAGSHSDFGAYPSGSTAVDASQRVASSAESISSAAADAARAAATAAMEAASSAR